jgi:hypothetical protein
MCRSVNLLVLCMSRILVLWNTESSRVRDLWPVQCRVKSNISSVCSAPSLHHAFKRCLPTRLLRSNFSLTGLQPTLAVTSANLALNRCFLKLGTAPAYTGGRYRASSSPELLAIHRSSQSIMSHKCLQCVGPFLSLITDHNSRLLSYRWLAHTCINDHDIPRAPALACTHARARTHTHTRLVHTFRFSPGRTRAQLGALKHLRF